MTSIFATPFVNLQICIYGLCLVEETVEWGELDVVLATLSLFRHGATTDALSVANIASQ